MRRHRQPAARSDRQGMIDVWDRPGMGVEINPAKAKQYPAPEDAGLFD
jgi:L-alanine-DL-glutamate epimerase-like enolase superfamily enzyme